MARQTFRNALIFGLLAVTTALLAQGGETDKPVRPTGRDILSLAQAISASKVDRTRAEKFLDALLAGNVVWVASKPASSTGEIVCYFTNCDSKTCAECDMEEETCWCSDCCIAAAPQAPLATQNPQPAQPVAVARQRKFGHKLVVGNPPTVFTVNPKGTITLVEAHGTNASAFLRCEEYKLSWGIPKVGESRLIERGCPNMELFTNGLATGNEQVYVTVRVDD
jgi:hypothetical protein